MKLTKNIITIGLIIFYFLSPLSLFAAELNADSSKVNWQKLHGLGKTEYFTLAHTKEGKTDFPYHIFVRLPVGYNPSEAQRYPTLYLLDGGTNFPLVSAYYNYLHMMEDVPAMIIVGISYGDYNWRKGNDRGHDFTLPSKEQTHWGGAPNFDAFISQSLMPIVQQKYLVDENKQILFGQSLGGQFALYTSMYGKAPFYAVIASNPALHRNLDSFKQIISRPQQRPKAFVSIAEFDDPRFRKPALQWVKFWQEKDTNWPYKVDYLDSHNHLSATPDALRNGLKWVFNK